MNSKHLKYVWQVLLALVALFIFSLAIKALYRLTKSVHMADVLVAIGRIPTSHLIVALLVVAFGYILLTLYDVIAIRQIRKSKHIPLSQAKVRYPKIALTAYIAYAISHTVGANVVTASGVRYRFYHASGLTTAEIANVVWLVSMAFTFGISTLVGLSLVISPEVTLQLLGNLDRSLGFFDKAIYTQLLGILILGTIVGLIIWSGKLGKHVMIKGWRFDVPPAGVLLQQIAISILDLSTVALVLWLLMPSDANIGYLATFSAFIQSMCVGILSHVPGGLGVFEVTMLAAFPQVDKAQMLGILLVFRVMYYILPFLLALILFASYESYHYFKRQP